MRHTLTLLLLAISLAATAARPLQHPDSTYRPAATAITAAIGTASVADTYLSPLIYNGYNISLAYERLRAMKFAPDRWITRLHISLGADHGNNPAGNGSIWQGSLDASWGIIRRWTLPSAIRLGIGPTAIISAGAVYNPRNGNNPAVAKAALNIGATAFASRMFRIAGTQILARLSTSAPLIGTFFSQQYGELYYEIWLGNHSHLIHGAWPGNYRRLDTTLTADIHLGSSWLRIGFSNQFLSTKICHITSRLITNSFVIGISGEWLSLSTATSRISPRTRIISALY